MAKTKTPTNSSSLDRSLVTYAETLGAAMGNLRNHVDTWKGQRKHLVAQLSSMVNEAQALLADLGHTATERASGLRRGRKTSRATAAPNPAGALNVLKRKKRQISEAGRAAISAAQKKRWAAYKNKRIPK